MGPSFERFGPGVSGLGPLVDSVGWAHLSNRTPPGPTTPFTVMMAHVTSAITVGPVWSLRPVFGSFLSPFGKFGVFPVAPTHGDPCQPTMDHSGRKGPPAHDPAGVDDPSMGAQGLNREVVGVS